MAKLGTVWKVAIVAAIAIVLVVVSFMYGFNRGKSQAVPSSNSSAASSTAVNAATTTATSSGQTSPTQTKTATKTGGAGSGVVTYKAPSVVSVPVMTLTSPAAGDIWQIGTDHTIAWSRAGNFSGQIDLLDASTGLQVGVVLPQVGTNQTSYTWNARSVSLSRTNPQGKDVLPGAYRIRISFDGNNQPILVSPTFAITN